MKILPDPDTQHLKKSLSLYLLSFALMQGLFVLFCQFLEASSLCPNREERTKDKLRGTARFRGITERDSAQKNPNLSPPASRQVAFFSFSFYYIYGQGTSPRALNLERMA
jgi:hypothetical protein